MSSALEMDKSQTEKGGKFNTGDNINFLLTKHTVLITHPQDMTKWHFDPSFHPVQSKHILRETSKENAELQIPACESTFPLPVEEFLNALFLPNHPLPCQVVEKFCFLNSKRNYFLLWEKKMGFNLTMRIVKRGSYFALLLSDLCI